jgi:hypothetical protein
VEELNQASQAMAQHLYSQAGATPGGTDGQAGQPKSEDVQDAEFEVKK